MTVTPYRPEYKEQVIALFRAVTEQKTRDAIFWWPSEEEFTWAFCQCVFAGEQLIAKGQIQPINVLSEGHDPEGSHEIYVNMKVHPDWDHEIEVKELLYGKLHEIALEMKNGLPPEFGTNLCVGNFATEATSNEYFASKGFAHFASLFWMERDLQVPVEQTKAPSEDMIVKKWFMESEAEELQYIQAEAKIWPDSSIGLQRLREYKARPHWAAFSAFANGEIIGSAMAWEHHTPDTGEIEDIFVMPEYRKQGIARHLIARAIQHLQDAGLQQAFLQVLTDNEKALNLYRSVGFEVAKEEQRFKMVLA